MSISLASITKTKHQKPPRIVIHGAEKCGKSTFFSKAPGVIFIQTEDGLAGIDTNAFPLAKTMDDVFESIWSLQNEANEYKTVVIDSADWLERLVHDRVCNDHGVATIELAAGGYGKGYGEALNHWRMLLSMLDELSVTKHMTIGLICHSRIVTINDPETEPYDSWKMKLHEPKSGNAGALSLLNEWADVIGFATKKVFTKEQVSGDPKDKKKVVKHKAIGGERELRLEGSPAFLAGNRYGLPAVLPLDWAAFDAALTATFK